MIYIDNEKIKLVNTIFLVIWFVVSVGFAMDFITSKVAFPTIFTCIGGQQIFNGLISKNKQSKILSITFGILVMLFVIFKLMPKYYFK